jgi:uncharacterized protein (TIGR02246 family)
MSISNEDFIEIQQLMYRYARCADQRDYAGFAGVFTEDATLVYMGNEIVGLGTIQKTLTVLEKYKRTFHQVFNVDYQVDGNEATGETYCQAAHIMDGDTGELKHDMGIRYKDKLTKEAEGWRIQFRDLELVWTQTSAIDEG